MKKGYYLVHRDIPPLVGLAYCSAGGDNGFTYTDACDQQKENLDLVVINNEGEVVFPYFIKNHDSSE